jgi:putative hydrolase of the HAD superfamily
MISTIIFDLGNVLISWKPAEYFENNGYEKTRLETILNEVFHSPEWLMLDNGDLSLREAVDRIAAKSSLKKEEIRAIFDLRTKIIFPLHFNTKLLNGLKKHGFRLYFLSNFPDDIFDEIYHKYDFFRQFDGGEISARVNASKPDERIFRILMEKHSLDAAGCLFIDDSHKNTVSAELLGMKAIHLEEPGMLREKLEAVLGIIIDS